MAMKICRSQIRHRKLDERTEREEEEEKDTDCFQPTSLCPACNGACDVALILPCSHTMCGHCVAAGERGGSGRAVVRSAGPSVCSLPCPRCRQPVELPCSTWSAAVSCLPEHPALSPVHANMEAAMRQCESYLQSDTHCGDEADGRAQSCLPVTTSPVTPVDGVVDLREEEMEQSVFGLRFALDPSTVHPSLRLSNAALTVTYRGPATKPPHCEVRRSKAASDPGSPPALPQACADVTVARGQYYWEVDVCNSSMYRIGVISLDGRGSWWLERQGSSFCAVYDGSWEPLRTVPPQVKTLGVFLNIGGGALSFHNPLTQEHLATLPTRFGPAGVLPALGLGQGRLRLRCRLPPPPHVFLGKDSVYRGPSGVGGARWRREIPFRSVRKVIQKFEELAVSDSDSGLVSSFGSSCSTLASLPDLGIPGMFPSGQAGQEAGPE